MTASLIGESPCKRRRSRVAAYSSAFVLKHNVINEYLFLIAPELPRSRSVLSQPFD